MRNYVSKLTIAPANQATRFLIYASPLDPLHETTQLVLDDATKYIVHVALSDGVSKADHYAIMWLDTG